LNLINIKLGGAILFNKLIYINLTQDNITLSRLINTKDKYNLQDQEVINLDKQDITENKIFNLNKIFLLIKDYLDKNNLKNSYAIINLQENIFKNNLIILQLALIFGKTSLKIKKIINTQEKIQDFIFKKTLDSQENLFQQFLPPKKHDPKNWLIFAVFLISFEIIFLTKSLINKNNLNNKLNLEINNLNLKNNLLKIELNKKNNILKITKDSQKNKLMIKNLVNIAQSLPNNIKLTKIEINNKKNSKKFKKYVFKGESKTEQDLSNFMANLSKLPQFYNLKISKFQKVSNSCYYFSSSANLLLS